MTNNNIYFIALVDGLQLLMKQFYMKCYPFKHIIFACPSVYLSGLKEYIL